MSPIDYSRTLLKISVSQILQAIGFQSVHSTALDILVEVLERYICLLSKSSHDYAEYSNRTEPNLDDVAHAFNKYKINLLELEEYINFVDTPEFSLKKHNAKNLVSNSIEKWGELIPPEAKLKQKLKPNSDYLGYCSDPTNKEILDRQSDEENEYIYDYMPLMTKSLEVKPELLEQDQNELQKSPPKPEEEKSSDIVKNGLKFPKNFYKSSYELKSAKRTEPIQSNAKLPTYFHKPRSKYKKQVYLNALSYCNKSISQNLNLTQQQEETEIQTQPQTENVEVQQPQEQVPQTVQQEVVEDQQKPIVDQMLESLITKYSSSNLTSATTQKTPNIKLKLKTEKEIAQPTSFSISLDEKQPIDLSVQQIPKLKITSQKLEENIHDDNANDGLNINEPLIWKPICNMGNSNSSTNLAIQQTSPKPKPLVDYSSSNEVKVESKMETQVIEKLSTDTIVKHKKKKKNKDKSKNKDKDKDKDKDKHHHHKKKDKEKEKNKESNDPIADSNSKKEEKRLKKLLKKQKKLEKQVQKSQTNSMNTPDTTSTTTTTTNDVSTVSEDINSPLLNKIKQNIQNPTSTPNLNLKVEKEDQQPRLPKLKLKLNQTETLEIENNLNIKPIKLNLTQNQPEPEVELGEIVKPMASPSKPAEIPKQNITPAQKQQQQQQQQPKQIPKLIIKPVNKTPQQNQPQAKKETQSNPNQSSQPSPQQKIQKPKPQPKPVQKPIIEPPIPPPPIFAPPPPLIPPELLAQEALVQEALAQEVLAQEALAQASLLPLLLPFLQAQAQVQNQVMNNPPFDLASIINQNLNLNQLQPPILPTQPQPDLGLNLNQNKKRKTENTSQSQPAVQTQSQNKPKQKLNSSLTQQNQQQQPQQSHQQQQQQQQQQPQPQPQHKSSNLNKSLESQKQVIFDDYEQSNEYKWHQMRIKQEEESLKEQLNALNMSRNNQNLSQNQPKQTNQQPAKIKQKPKADPETIFTPTISNSSNNKPQSSNIKQKIVNPNPPAQQNSEPIDLSIEKASSNNNSMKIIGQVLQVTEVASNQYWVCPSCSKSDESLPMIACDSCDDWYHWHCIGIKQEPPKKQNWYCSKCNTKPETQSTSQIQQQVDNNTFTDNSALLTNQNDLSAMNANNTLSFLNQSLLSSTSNNNISPPSDYLSSLKKKKKKP